MFSEKDLVSEINELLEECISLIDRPTLKSLLSELRSKIEAEELTPSELLREKALLLTLHRISGEKGQTLDERVRRNCTNAIMCCIKDIHDIVKGGEPKVDSPF